MASQLFSPLSLRQLTIANRTVVSAMCQYVASNGNANDIGIIFYGISFDFSKYFARIIHWCCCNYNG